MKRFFNLSIFLIAAVAFAVALKSCNTVKTVSEIQLSGNWVLKSLNGEDAKDAFQGQIPYLSFDFAKKTVSGNGGCNGFNGGYSLTDKNEFSATRLVSTKMACMQANKESDFLSALSTPNLIVAVDKDGNLTFSKDDVVVFEFIKGTSSK